ncbi:MAG TPA: hypothetical protein VIL17_07170 [Coriobacteriia bacterium]
MNFVVPSRYRWAVTLGSIAAPIVGLVIAALTLPPLAAVGVTAALTVLAWVLNRTVFKYVAVLVMAMPTEAMERFWFGTACIADPETLENTRFALVYLNRTAARDAYRMLVTWSFGKQVDTEAHIRLSIVDEGDWRYSIFVAAGERAPAREEVARILRERAGGRAVVQVQTSHPFLRNCVDYSDVPDMQRVMEALPFFEEVGLEVRYVQGEKLVPYAKKPFRLRNFTIIKRADLAQDAYEREFPWEDLRSGVSQYVTDVASRIGLETDT